MENNWKKETQCVQSGYTPEDGEPRILPIFQSTTYKYSSADHVAALFDLKAAGHIYSRISNPTVEALEKKIAELEGGSAALAVSSGQSAITLAILNIASAGDHIVSSSALYGGTYNLFEHTLRKLGIEVTFVDPTSDAGMLEAAFRPNTKALYGETLGNPGLVVLDFAKFSAVAKKKGVPLIIDNTFPTPFLNNPFQHGADIIVHSSTKYLDGHATSLGGIIVEKGDFPWDNGKYPELTQPDPSYHGISYHTAFPSMAYIIKARVQLLRDLGMAMAPMNAFLTQLGSHTLHLRMERHSANALGLARFLEKHPAVEWVNYPLLETSPSYELAKEYLPNGASGVLTFGIKGGADAGKKFIDSVRLSNLVVHVGDIRTCVLHPASTTHRQLSEKEQKESGVSPEMVRISVGIENLEDLKDDISQALDKTR